MSKENVLIKIGEEVRHETGVYRIYYIKDLDDVTIYVGGSLKSVADCYSRHDSSIKSGAYAGTNKDILDKLHKAGEKLYFKVITYCSEDDMKRIETEYINFYADTAVNRDKVGKARTTKPTPEETERRRRANSGERNPRAFLTDEEIGQLRVLIDSKQYRDKELAKMFKCSLTHISNIRHNKKRIKEKEVTNTAMLETSTPVSEESANYSDK